MGSPYAILVNGAVDPDYSISDSPGSLIVTPAPLTIQVSSTSKVYGQPNPVLASVVTGILNGDNVTPQLTTTAMTSSPVLNGGYPITVTGISGTKAGDYFVSSSQPGTLTVTPAPLTIQTNNQSRIYGQSNPSSTASYQGFVLGQNSSVLTGQLKFTTPATPAPGRLFPRHSGRIGLAELRDHVRQRNLDCHPGDIDDFCTERHADLR